MHIYTQTMISTTASQHVPRARTSRKGKVDYYGVSSQIDFVMTCVCSCLSIYMSVQAEVTFKEAMRFMLTAGMEQVQNLI